LHRVDDLLKPKPVPYWAGSLRRHRLVLGFGNVSERAIEQAVGAVSDLLR
jgi:hypothetical protein